IYLNTEIPDTIVKMPLIEVEYYFVGREDVEYYLGIDYEEVLEGVLFKKGDESFVRIENNKKLIYNIRDVNGNLEINEEDALTTVENYIKEEKMDLSDYKVDLIIKREEMYEIIYKRYYEGIPLENDYYKFIVDNKGVAGFESQVIKNIEPKEGMITVTSAYESLLRLKNENLQERVNITNMEICYYTDENVEGWANILRANMDPTWKVVTEKGNIKYLTEVE
ncbi:MAG TPA: hypothetical protein DHM42_10620, partial [Clostridiales bacterium]|nr:hypothetical protein [Clostridiales bacterium]